jgi:hypothetical protein
LHALLELMQLDASHESLDGQDQAVVEVEGMVQPVLVGQQGVEGRTDLDEPATGFILAGQAIDLEAEHEADMPEGDFGQEPGEIVATDGCRGAAALIAIENADTFAWPAPVEGVLLQVGLDLRGFAVTFHLLRMRLADIDDSPSFQVVEVDLGRAVRLHGFRSCHRPPPLRRRRGVRGFAAAVGLAG